MKNLKEELINLLNKHRQKGCQDVDCDVCDEKEKPIIQLFNQAITARDEEWMGKIEKLKIQMNEDFKTDGVGFKNEGSYMDFALDDLINSMK